MLPLTLIVTALAMLNLDKAVFAVMGGLHERTANDEAYRILVAITVLSLYLFVPLLIAYLVLAIARFTHSRKASKVTNDAN
jgi:hypothetical protein